MKRVKAKCLITVVSNYMSVKHTHRQTYTHRQTDRQTHKQTYTAGKQRVFEESESQVSYNGSF